MAAPPSGEPPKQDESIGKPARALGLKIDFEAAKGTLENIRKQEAAFEQQEQKGVAPALDPSTFKRPLSARGAPSLEQLHEAGVYRKAKKPSIRGQILEEGSVGWETMLDMLTGIRVVCSVKDYRSVKLTQADFQTTRNLKFPRRGSKYTPPHTQRTFTFRDYAPLVFARIREKFGLDPADYLDALTRDARMTCIRSPGKSASMFFYSYDGRFMVKTINKEECMKLMDILPAYYDHINMNPDTIITRFYGLHKVKPKKERSNYIVVMANVLNSAYFDMDEIYDLKGSTVGRTVNANEKGKKEGGDNKEAAAPAAEHKKLDPNKIYKDLDFTRGFCFGPMKAKILFDQMASDLKFLEDNNIMDYSMLLGVHELTENDLFARPDKPHGAVTPRRAVENVASIPVMEYVSRFTHDWGGFCSSDTYNKPGTAIYFMGIIDILQDYNLRKQLEHGIKALQYDGDQISCVEPKLFASRFLKYMRDKLRSLPSSEMRTLSDLQQAASSMHEESEFGMLTPRRQYHRQLQLELEGKIPAKEPTARPPPSPRFAVPAPAQADNELSSSDSSSSESEEPSSSQHSEASGASGASGGHHRHHKKRHHKHRHHHGHHKPQNTSLLSVSPATSSPLKEKALEHRDGKSEKSDKSDSKSSDKSKSESKSEKKDK